jgi:hypothetical protein
MEGRTMVKAGLLFVAVLLVVGWTAPTASAATCDDYSNQADAQRAMDTRDADTAREDQHDRPWLTRRQDAARMGAGLQRAGGHHRAPDP